MLGDWAGDFGQTQFLPSSYYKYAVDFDPRRPARSRAQRAGRARLHRQLSQGLRLGSAGQRWNEGDPNFEAIRGWNKAMVYAKTVATFAERLEGGSARAEEPRR